MAKYESRMKGDFDELLHRLDYGILEGSASAHYEDGSDYATDGVRCAVRVYERYSVLGGSRVSLNITLVGKDEDLFISTISSGGSQAMFFKFNRWGEGNFLQCALDIIEGYKREDRS